MSDQLQKILDHLPPLLHQYLRVGVPHLVGFHELHSIMLRSAGGLMNGAVALLSATFVAPDPQPVLARLQALGSPEGVEVVDADTFAARHGWRPARLPGLHALEVGVQCLQRALTLLESRGVPLTLADSAAWIGPSVTGGFAMGLREVAA